MAYGRVDKNKILGFGLVIFFLFLLTVWLLPNPGIDGWVFNAQEVDSIRLVRPDRSYLLVTDHTDIAAFSAQIKSCKPIL